MIPQWLGHLKRPLQIGSMVAVCVAVISLFMPNYYKSEARILPVQTRSGAGGLGALAAAAAAFGVTTPGADGGDANFVDILNSRWLRERLLASEFHFKARSWRFGPLREQKATLYQFLEAKNVDRGLKKLAPMIMVSKDAKSMVITLAVESTSPTLSQQVAQAALRLLEVFVQEKGRTRGSAKALYSAARLSEAREEMNQAEEQFRQFLESNRNYLTSSDPSVRLKGARLEAELKLRQQLVMTLAMNREQALMEEKNDMPILNVMDYGNTPEEKSRPARSTMILMAFLLTFGGTLVYENWSWLKDHLLESEDSTRSTNNAEGDS